MRIRLFLSNRNYFFDFNLSNVYVYIVNVNIFFIYVKNEKKIAKIILKYSNFKIIVKYDDDVYYIIYLNNHIYAIIKNKIKINKFENVSNIKLNNDISIFENEN